METDLPRSALVTFPRTHTRAHTRSDPPDPRHHRPNQPVRQRRLDVWQELQPPHLDKGGCTHVRVILASLLLGYFTIHLPSLKGSIPSLRPPPAYAPLVLLGLANFGLVIHPRDTPHPHNHLRNPSGPRPPPRPASDFSSGSGNIQNPPGPAPLPPPPPPACPSSGRPAAVPQAAAAGAAAAGVRGGVRAAGARGRERAHAVTHARGACVRACLRAHAGVSGCLVRDYRMPSHRQSSRACDGDTAVRT